VISFSAVHMNLYSPLFSLLAIHCAVEGGSKSLSIPPLTIHMYKGNFLWGCLLCCTRLVKSTDLTLHISELKFESSYNLCAVHKNQQCFSQVLSGYPNWE